MSALKNGRPGPVLLEMRSDAMAAEVDNTDELLGRLITEAPRQPEDDFEDEGIGVPNSMLQRSTDSFERDEIICS